MLSRVLTIKHQDSLRRPALETPSFLSSSEHTASRVETSCRMWLDQEEDVKEAEGCCIDEAT
jgi:hypothetical protein